MSQINEKNIHLSENNLKKPRILGKSLTSIKKASIPSKMSSKSLVIFKKASDFLIKPAFL
jgi:hypothetical protein